MSKTDTYQFTPSLILATLDAPVGSKMKISAANTMDVAGSGDFVVGTLKTTPTKGNTAGLACRFNCQHNATSSGVIAAGDLVKIGSAGTGGNQRMVKWVSGTDNPSLVAGIALTATTGADETFNGLFY
jgi:hypothetical protein